MQLDSLRFPRALVLFDRRILHGGGAVFARGAEYAGFVGVQTEVAEISGPGGESVTADATVGIGTTGRVLHRVARRLRGLRRFLHRVAQTFKRWRETFFACVIRVDGLLN